MVIEQWTGPPVETHTYLVADPESREAWVIDAPLDTAPDVLRWVLEHEYRLTRVILTHGHFDHILGVDDYQQAGIPVSVNPLETPLLHTPQTALFGLPYEMPRVQIDEALSEGMELQLGGTTWEVWHTPGHSPGHIILYSAARATVLGGDLLFQNGYGRIDLPGANRAAMAQSLGRIAALPPETRVFPGHGPDTTIGRERRWLEGLLAEGGP